MGNYAVIVNSIPVYLCDPTKHEKCRKTSCGKECFRTLNKECSLFGQPFQYMQQIHKECVRSTQ